LGLRCFAGRALTDVDAILQSAELADPRPVLVFRQICLQFPDFWTAARQANFGRAGVLEGAAFADPSIVGFVVVIVLVKKSTIKNMLTKNLSDSDFTDGLTRFKMKTPESKLK
jgi:hypothetical protein